MEHTIEIVILPDGTLQSTVKGVKGPSCSELSKWLDNLGTVVEDRKTDDHDKDDKQIRVQYSGR